MPITTTDLFGFLDDFAHMVEAWKHKRLLPGNRKGRQAGKLPTGCDIIHEEFFRLSLC